VLRPGDAVEIRGPVGGWFVWRPEAERPVLLVAGGSGIAPLMAMIRARRLAGSAIPFRLLYSTRTPADAFYTGELQRPDPGLSVTHVYTRKAPDGSARPPGRLTPADLDGVPTDPDCFICGPTGFVETAADMLIARGHDPRRIKTERFG
jgi:ferredoxin-NADP reductase